jgi:hypothetical protein
MAGFGLVVVLVVVVVAVRLLAGGLDGDRIDAYLEQRGCTVLDRSWAPFGKGWFGEKNDRIYEVVYRDQQGATRRATVKTSMFAGVYLTDDRVVEEAPAADAGDTVAALRAENERLRARLADRGEDAPG